MELALAPALAAQAPIPTRPNRATQRSVPAFLNKLYSMVSDQSTDDLIRWSDDGDSFFVPSADRFGKELLPRFFKHSNFGSFVRQLNMYGFHKVPHLQQGVLKRDQSEEADVLEFSNPHFMRGQPDLLCMIKRQKAGKGETAAAAAVAGGLGVGSGSGHALDGRTSSGGANSAAASLNIATLLSDLAAIRKHQTAISADLKDLQARNHALWQEALQSREKHKKQEETINKILRFLAGVFGGQVIDAGASGGQQQQQVGAGNHESSASPSASASGSAMGGGGNGSSVGGSGSATGKNSSSANGAGGARGGGAGGGRVVVMPTKSRLLLEDVKGRQQQRRAALRELDGEDEEDVEVLRREEEEDDDDEEIEEIPLLHSAEDEEDMPVISSALITSGPGATSGALTRVPSNSSFAPPSSSSSRFATLPSPTTHASPIVTTPSGSTNPNNGDARSGSLIDPAQYNLPPEALKALLTAAGNNPQALQDFFARSSSASNGAGFNVFSSSSSSSSSAPTSTALSLAGPSASMASTSGLAGPASTSSALLPYHPQAHYTSNPLDFSFSSAPSPHFATSLAPTTSALTAASLPSPVNFETAFAENNDVLSSVLSEKADIDQRTAALENQITRLLDNLPDDAREQVENEAANGENSSWAGIDWDNYTNDDGGVDFDKMLAQLSEISSHNETPIDYSELLSNNALDPALSGISTSISSAPTSSSAMIDPSLYGLGPSTSASATQPAYEVTFPAETPLTAGVVEDLASPASTVNSPASTASSSRKTSTTTTGGKGKKRKSDAMAESPAAGGEDEAAVGTRRSTRRKRS
ncbi:hypothetical protein JCM10908_001811 [Rhodotorula pacifica]|uniref:uncharacterized protein n=1 Tax=Rhodotorula pacifica TaxID=1495444 RepID=UPI00317BCAFB